MKGFSKMSKEEKTDVCEHPEKLKGKPGECSPEQIKKCHGHDKNHPANKKK